MLNPSGIIKDTGFLMLTMRDLIGADRDLHAFFNVIAFVCRHCNEVRPAAGPCVPPCRFENRRAVAHWAPPVRLRTLRT